MLKLQAGLRLKKAKRRKGRSETTRANMVKTFDMQFIRYMNLFGKITKVTAKHCFMYNNMIVFVVPRYFVEKAIGRNNENLKRLSGILSKRIRVVAEPRGRKDIGNFVFVLITPIRYQSLEVKDDEIVIVAGRESKAMLIGRERARERELMGILEQYFGIKSVRIM